MAETRVLAPALRMVEEAGGKAVLIGDPAQLPAVGAGGLFAALCARLGTTHLVENRRQRDLAERRALEDLRAGEGESYLAHAAASGRLRLADDAHEAKGRLLEDWWRAVADDLEGSVMLAHRREDVRDLNAAARALLGDAGRLGGEPLVAGERDFRSGDRVVCRRNERLLGVRNGTRGTIAAVDLGKGLLTLRTDAGEACRLSAGYARDHLDHGYALTGHAAQGATVNRAFVLLRGEGALAEWTYVACSRAREETLLYGAAPELDRDGDADMPARRPASHSLAAALRRSAPEPLATERFGHEVHAPAPRVRERTERSVDRIRHAKAIRQAAGAERGQGIEL